MFAVLGDEEEHVLRLGSQVPGLGLAGCEVGDGEVEGSFAGPVLEQEAESFLVREVEGEQVEPNSLDFASGIVLEEGVVLRLVRLHGEIL